MRELAPVKWVNVKSLTPEAIRTVYIWQSEAGVTRWLSRDWPVNVFALVLHSLNKFHKVRGRVLWRHYTRCVSATRPRNDSGSCQVWSRAVRLRRFAPRAILVTCTSTVQAEALQTSSYFQLSGGASSRAFPNNQTDKWMTCRLSWTLFFMSSSGCHL